MNSKDRPSPHGGSQGSGFHPKSQAAEDTLRTETIQIERKSFIFTLKDNPRGRLLRITEDVNGRRDSIIVPATGLEDFRRALEEMLATSAATPLPPSTE